MAAARKNEETRPEAPALKDTLGHELLRDPAELLPSEILALMSGIGEDVSDVSTEDIVRLTALIEARFVINLDDWRAFYREHGLTAVIELVTAYLGEALGDAS